MAARKQKPKKAGSKTETAEVKFPKLAPKEIRARAGRAFDKAISIVFYRPPLSKINAEVADLKTIIENQVQRSRKGRANFVKALKQLNRKYKGKSYLYRAYAFTRDTGYLSYSWQPRREGRKVVRDVTVTVNKFVPIARMRQLKKELEQSKDGFVQIARVLSDHAARKAVGKSLGSKKWEISDVRKIVMSQLFKRLKAEVNPPKVKSKLAVVPRKPGQAAPKTNELYISLALKFVRKGKTRTAVITISSLLPPLTQAEYNKRYTF